MFQSVTYPVYGEWLENSHKPINLVIMHINFILPKRTPNSCKKILIASLGFPITSITVIQSNHYIIHHIATNTTKKHKYDGLFLFVKASFSFSLVFSSCNVSFCNSRFSIFMPSNVQELLGKLSQASLTCYQVLPST
jgi:hypothetical protein